MTHADAHWPPSTLKSEPCMNADPSESKKTAGSFRSSGTPNRPNNAPPFQIVSISGRSARSRSVMGVRIYCERHQPSPSLLQRGTSQHLRRERCCSRGCRIVPIPSPEIGTFAERQPCLRCRPCTEDPVTVSVLSEAACSIDILCWRCCQTCWQSGLCYQVAQPRAESSQHACKC